MDYGTSFLLFMFVMVVFLLVLSIVVVARRSFSSESGRELDVETPNMNVEILGNVEPLVNALKSTDSQARNEIVSALGNIGTEAVVDPLITVLLYDPDARVRENAAFWLGQIGNEKAVNPLMGILKTYLGGGDTPANLAVASAAALGDIGNEEGLAVVRELKSVLEQRARPEQLKRVTSAVKEIELTRDLTTKKCIVCNLPLGSKDKIVQCPSCKNVGHQVHMLEWLRQRDYCPACRAKIRESHLIDIQPKSLQTKRGKSASRRK